MTGRETRQSTVQWKQQNVDTKKRQLTRNRSVDSLHNVSILFLVNDSLDSVLPVGQVCPADRTQKNTLFLMESVLLAGHCCRHRSCVLP